MAKKSKKSNNTTVSGFEVSTATLDPPSSQEVVEEPKELPLATELDISIPMGEVDAGYCSTQLASTKITRRQAAAFKRLFCTLKARHEKVGIEGRTEGKVVEDLTHVLRWLGDRLADAYESNGVTLEGDTTLSFLRDGKKES